MPKKPVRPVAIKKTGYQYQTEKLGFEDKFAAVTDTPLTKAQDSMINKSKHRFIFRNLKSFQSFMQICHNMEFHSTKYAENYVNLHKVLSLML